ncbi:DoxX family membrane protein [Kaistella sp. G5-32]|uniref:DoxX family membrane protein n=1 Tax=Kaistella gelatinilytica TaxID=2787636 RepID=A0ABS0FB08_9FLAO|nr:DoxX family membrane protein [Kaistella gelatinilytica]MBF8456891.1 DoxX family membrane protein [Kaistella gelatinilytica]
MTLASITNSKFFDYLILAIRFLLAATFISYGYGKLTEGQFGLTPLELQKPIGELNLMQIGWYLFDQQPFKYFIGISQIICGILLLINRTVLIGAILFLPIAVNILIIDLTIMPSAFATAFALRFTSYIFLDGLLFFHYRKQCLEGLQKLLQNVKPKYKHRFWTLLFIPLLALILEILPFIPKVLWGLMQDPKGMLTWIKEMTGLIMRNLQ